MPFYRLYFIDERTSRIDRHQQFEAADDEAALQRIGSEVGGQPLELWSGGRKVGHFGADMERDFGRPHGWTSSDAPPARAA